MTIRFLVQTLTWLSIFSMLWLMVLKVIPTDVSSWGWVILFCIFALGTANTEK